MKNDLGTNVQFIEWWTKEYLCWTLGKKVLLKKKNPHWNYDGVQESSEVDAYGNETQISLDTKGINHFPVPDIPYILLSIYNLDEQPVDKTSLIGQNLANQDRINKRSKQIDENADGMNSGIVVSLARAGLTAPQARGVTGTLKRGGTVAIPDGKPARGNRSLPSPTASTGHLSRPTRCPRTLTRHIRNPRINTGRNRKRGHSARKNHQPKFGH